MAKEKKEPKAITTDRVTEENNSERTNKAIKGKYVKIVALQGVKHMKEGSKHTVGAELAKQLIDSKRAKLA